MENVHLAPEGDDDDLYSGYDYNDPMLEVLVTVFMLTGSARCSTTLINAQHRIANFPSLFRSWRKIPSFRGLLGRDMDRDLHYQ